MNREQFIELLAHPETLTGDTVQELTELVQTFPYFQSARILLTINLFKEQNIRYNSELKVTAIYAGSRNILKKHIDRAGKERVLISFEKEKQEKETTTAEKTPAPETPMPEETATPSSAETKTEAENNHREKTTEEDTISQLKKIIENRIREIEEEKKEQKSGKKKRTKPDKKKKFEIIDEFIAKEPTISRPKAKFYDPVESAKQSVVDQEEIISETLAKIYFDQGYFEKAIQMYEKLILKNPEKSSYFAALIEKANNELNKNQ